MSGFFSPPGAEGGVLAGRASGRVARHGLVYRVLWWIAMALLCFVAGSVALTLIYRVVPPPVTLENWSVPWARMSPVVKLTP